MTEKIAKPQLRFAGFDDTWEQRKAIDIADYSKGNGYSKGDLADAGTPIILYGRLYTKYQFAISEVDTFAVPRNGAVYSQGNEVIVPASGETAEDIARASAVEKSGVLLGGDLNILRPFDFMNPLFLALAISNGEPQKELAKKAQGKSVVHIHNTDIQEVTIAYPSKTEQDRIVSVFRQLDNLITLHQRKYDKLTNVKKSMLEKMFPKNGSNVPEIRFRGFSDAWEQRKLGELSSLITKGTTPLDKSNMGTVNFVKIESIDNSSGEITITQKITSEEHEGYLRRSQLKENDILFSIAGTLGRVTSVKSSILPANTNQALAIIRLKSGCLKYVKTYLKGKAVADFIKKNPTIGAQPNLSLEQVSNLEIALPSDIEQEQIGSFFENLDNLITLHQRELEKLKNLKKACLEKMFV